MTVPPVQTAFQQQTIGEMYRWKILRNKMRELILDRRLAVTDLVATAVQLVTGNECTYMHEFIA